MKYSLMLKTFGQTLFHSNQVGQDISQDSYFHFANEKIDDNTVNILTQYIYTSYTITI